MFFCFTSRALYAGVYNVNHVCVVIVIVLRLALEMPPVNSHPIWYKFKILGTMLVNTGRKLKVQIPNIHQNERHSCHFKYSTQSRSKRAAFLKMQPVTYRSKPTVHGRPVISLRVPVHRLHVRQWEGRDWTHLHWKKEQPKQTQKKQQHNKNNLKTKGAIMLVVQKDTGIVSMSLTFRLDMQF